MENCMSFPVVTDENQSVQVELRKEKDENSPTPPQWNLLQRVNGQNEEIILYQGPCEVAIRLLCKILEEGKIPPEGIWEKWVDFYTYK